MKQLNHLSTQAFPLRYTEVRSAQSSWARSEMATALKFGDPATLTFKFVTTTRREAQAQHERYVDLRQRLKAEMASRLSNDMALAVIRFIAEER